MKVREINIVGAGSLGSFTVQLISKMNRVWGNPPIYVWDFDRVEGHNVDNQIYSSQDTGLLKVEALSSIIRSLDQSPIVPISEKIDRDTDLRGVVIVLVDNMKTRREIFERARFNFGVDYTIEARTGGLIARVIGFDPKNPDAVKKYSQTLFDDKEAIDPVCATNETVQVLWSVASAIAQLLLIFSKSKILRHPFRDIKIDFEREPIVS